MNAYVLEATIAQGAYVTDGTPHSLALSEEIGWAKTWPSPAHANAARLNMLMGDRLRVVKLPIDDTKPYSYGDPEPVSDTADPPNAAPPPPPRARNPLGVR